MYPDGIFEKKAKMARIERAYGMRKTAPPGNTVDEVRANERVAEKLPPREPDESELRDFYYESGPTAAGKKLNRGQYDPEEFKSRIYKVGFDGFGGAGAGYGAAAYAASQKRGKSIEDKHKDDVDDARRRATARRKFVERKRGLLLALSIIFFTALLVFGFYKLVFVVRNISVEGNVTYAEEEIIEASGVKKGLNLYSFRASSTDSNVTFKCPYVEKVEVKRSPPGTVLLSVTEDTPLFCAEIFGKLTVLSDGLRVLDTVPDGETAPDGLIKLELPGVSYSVEGRLIEFAGEKDERSIRVTLDALRDSPLYGRVTKIDLRDLYEITAVCDGKYLLSLGSSTDIDVKFTIAAKVLEDNMFSSGNKARINLSDPTKTSVVFDGTVEVD